ncbi:MAG TPA: hypothetical protein PK597_02340, partial [Oscillospiraceae bacterium]|nr:hypothetical protein [Oscillospiraceae bacterium]
MGDDGFMLELDDKHLLQFAENTARQETRTGGSGRARRQAKARLAALRHFCTHTAREKEVPVPAAEWLLDNWHITERAARESIAALRAAGRLPVAAATGMPMVSELASALCLAGGSPVTSERLSAFLAAAQRARPLSEKELSVFLPALRLAVVAAAAEGAKGCEDILARREREDDIFHAELAIYRLAAQGKGPTERLLEQKRQADALHERLSARMRWCFQTLRAMDSARFPLILEEASAVEHALRRDPADVYARMDEESRARYRARVTLLARERGMTEAGVAERAVALAAAGCGDERHVGYFLFVRPLGKASRPPVGALYVGSILLLTLFFTFFAGYFLQNFFAGLLVILPVWEIVKNCVDTLAVRFTPPRGIPRLDLPDGVPPEGKTLCVITALLTSEHDGEHYVNLLEEYRLANRDAGENLLFGLLADLPDGTAPMGEEARRRVDAAARAVAACNKRSGGSFLLLVRPPVFNPVEERYMGWERKRGALLELTRLLLGRESGVHVYTGGKAALGGVRFVITLDADTNLNVGAAKRMVGAMLHPLNRPKLDRARGVVTRGYGVLQPRVSPSLPAADKSLFSRIFAGQGGVDPYGSAVSDVYHDLFDQGTYVGKGIFDAEAFFLCLDERFPENRILSHDLLEGAYLRAGFLSDVELTDGYPYKVVSYYARLHRWIRGDWQILPWIGRRVKTPYTKEPNPVSALSRFKIFDNLRRSLTPVFTLAALFLGMTLSGRIFAAAAAVAALSAASRLLITGAELALRPGVPLHTRYHSGIMVGPGGAVLRTLLQLLLLPYQAWVSLSAASTALFRMFVTRKRLLDWTTASDTEKRGADGLPAVFLKMLPAAGIGAAALLFSQYPAGRAVGAVWALAPVFAWRLSRSVTGKKAAPEGDRAFLLHHAALIWGYFRDYLTARDHFLPPDNVQEAPAPQVAHRTSPTNIALALLSVAAAADLELCRRDEAAALLEKMLGSLERLEKWHGQPYNWYDTRTLRPLRPRYVSSVDSGNLCAALIALREALLEWGAEALAGRAGALADAMELEALYDRT